MDKVSEGALPWEPSEEQKAVAYDVLPSRMVIPANTFDSEIATALEPHMVPQS